MGGNEQPQSVWLQCCGRLTATDTLTGDYVKRFLATSCQCRRLSQDEANRRGALTGPRTPKQSSSLQAPTFVDGAAERAELQPSEDAGMHNRAGGSSGHGSRSMPLPLSVPHARGRCWAADWRRPSHGLQCLLAPTRRVEPVAGPAPHSGGRQPRLHLSSIVRRAELASPSTAHAAAIMACHGSSCILLSQPHVRASACVRRPR